MLAEPPWTDPGVKSRISVLDLISTKKKLKRGGGGGCMQGIDEPSPKILAAGKSHHPHVFLGATRFAGVCVSYNNKNNNDGHCKRLMPT